VPRRFPSPKSNPETTADHRSFLIRRLGLLCLRVEGSSRRTSHSLLIHFRPKAAATSTGCESAQAASHAPRFIRRDLLVCNQRGSVLVLVDALALKLEELCAGPCGRVPWSVAQVSSDLLKMFAADPCQPFMLRLAWHDAGTYNAADGSGGVSGSIRFKTEAAHGANAGLQRACSQLETIRAAHPGLGYGDLYQLAGVVAVASAGGPHIPFRGGRPDATEAECTAAGRLPDPARKADHLRDVFYRMGLDDREITVLSGAHTLGRAHKDRSGYEGAWTEAPLKFDNQYFRLLASGGKDGLLQLASDKALMEDPTMAAHVRRGRPPSCHLYLVSRTAKCQLVHP